MKDTRRLIQREASVLGAFPMRAVVWGVLLAIGVGGSTLPASGQTRTQEQERQARELERRVGRTMSHAELVERLRQSGLSRAQVRVRLQQMGYDPGLADQYFDTIERGGEPPRGAASSDLLKALQAIGVGVRGSPAELPSDTDSLRALVGDTVPMDTVVVDSLAAGELPIFGRELFQRATTQFQPVSTGPVDPDYRLGPGDQIALILTGDVETAYTLDVTREGFIVIPDVGQVFVNGLTIRELEDRLHDRLSAVYSGIGRSPSASAHFAVSLGRLRTNQVFIIGEVERPGAYQVSSVASVFNALYQARGPNKHGSFRRIEVRRGGRVIRTVDIYDYLLHGDSRDDIRLQQGDVIFVPLVGRQVAIKGSVRRAAVYELGGDDDLQDLLRYAGGLEARALSRIQIDRIVPVSERRPGVDRVLLDVDVSALAPGSGRAVSLQDGDLVQVFSVSQERRNRVTLTGEVRRPGVYEWGSGMTLWSLIRRADGLAERAYTPRAHVFRLNPEDGTRRLIQTPLLADSAGRPLRDVALADRDSVVIYDRAELTNLRLVGIDGFVKNPGTYELAEGMTVQDLVLAAGGFIAGADTSEVELARLPNVHARTDTIARIFLVPLSGDTANGHVGGSGSGYAGGKGVNGRSLSWAPSADELTLRHGDRVFVRKAVGYELPRTVKITGAVLRPGTYTLHTRHERLVELLARAGGLTSEGNPEGLQLIRRDRLVATDLPRAMNSPGGRFNLVLEAGDSIHAPRYDPTILVTGAVAFESRILYVPGASLDYYINRAGGYGENADRKKVSIQYQDGERATVRSYGLLQRAPAPGPGSTIFVPAKPEVAAGFNWDQFLSRTLSVVSTTVTLIIALNQL